MSPEPSFDLVFCDTCLGGSTVATRLAETHRGLRAFYLADYAVNPLGVKNADAVEAALAHWIDVASTRSDTLVIACNTASVLFDASRERLLGQRAVSPRIWSMVDFADALLHSTPGLAGSRVCLMGTQFTVRQRTYYERLARVGVHDVVPLAATTTERVVARMEHTCHDGRDAITAEIGHAIRTCDAVLLACTCFPLVSDLIAELNPHCRLLDPALGIGHVLPPRLDSSPNRLTLALTGDELLPADASRHAHALFKNWEIDRVVSMQRPRDVCDPDVPLVKTRG